MTVSSTGTGHLAGFKVCVFLRFSRTYWTLRSKIDRTSDEPKEGDLTLNKGQLELSVLILAILSLGTGCGGPMLSSNQAGISPASTSLIPGDVQSFTTRGLTPPLTWYVNDVIGGNESIGTIDAQGNYAAPQSSPLPGSVSIAAGDGTSTVTATIKIVGPSLPLRLWSSTISTGTTLTAVAVDSTGNSITSGSSLTGFPEVRSDFIVSFDPTGLQRWEIPLTSSEVNDIAADQTGGAMLVGGQGQYPWIARISSDGQIVAQTSCSNYGSFYSIVGHGNDYYFEENGTITTPGNWILRATADGTGWCGTPLVQTDFVGDLAADDVELLVAGNLVTDPVLHVVVGTLDFYDSSGALKQGWNFGLNPPIGINNSPRIAESKEGSDTFIYVGGFPNNTQHALTKVDVNETVQPGWPVQWNIAPQNATVSDTFIHVLAMPSGGALTLAQVSFTLGSLTQESCDIHFFDKDGSLGWQINDGVNCSSAAITSDGRFLFVGGMVTTSQGIQNAIFEKYVLPF